MYLGVQSTVTLNIEFENRMSASSTSKFTVVNIFSALSVFLSVREYTVSARTIRKLLLGNSVISISSFFQLKHFFSKWNNYRQKNDNVKEAGESKAIFWEGKINSWMSLFKDIQICFWMFWPQKSRITVALRLSGGKRFLSGDNWLKSFFEANI